MMGAQNPVGRGQMSDLFGGSADCRATLKSCMDACRSR
jgi:hypothetical protein